MLLQLIIMRAQDWEIDAFIDVLISCPLAWDELNIEPKEVSVYSFYNILIPHDNHPFHL